MAALQQALLGYGSFAVVSGPMTISYQGLTTAGTGTTLSVPGVAIGTASADRVVCIGVHFLTAGASLTSATIGGVTAAIIGQTIGSGGGVGVGAALIVAAVPSGTTSTVGLTFGSASQAVISTYSTTGMSSQTPVGSVVANYTGGSGTYSTTAVSVQADGALLCVATPFSAAASYSATGFSINDQGTITSSGGGNNSYLAGSTTIASTNASYALSISRVGGSGSTFTGPIVSAAFR